jgi:hypothetical protein
MLNKLKKFMGFNSNSVVITNQNNEPQPQPQNTPVPYSEFSLQELEILLIALKECNLKGSQIEVFYNLVLKIQNKYMNLKQQ